jgi:ABC-2 type transport system ATP-binding protein
MTVTPMNSSQGGFGNAPLAVELHGVHKHFGSVQAVRGIDVRLESGEIVAILGPNGAGKTTTIDMILGLSQPTDGQVAVFGMHPRQAISRGLSRRSCRPAGC